MFNLAGVVINTVFNFLLVVVVTRGMGGTATGTLLRIDRAVQHRGDGLAVGRRRRDRADDPSVPAFGRTGGRPTRHPRGDLSLRSSWGSVRALLFVFAGPLGDLLTNGKHGDELTASLRVLSPFLPISAAYAVSLAVTRGFGTMVPSTLIDKVGKAITQPLLVFLAIPPGSPALALSVAWAAPFALGLAAALVWSRSCCAGASSS